MKINNYNIEPTEEEKRIGRERFNKEMEELKLKMESSEDYKIEYFDIQEDEPEAGENNKEVK
jgi:hypothetical protein